MVWGCEEGSLFSCPHFRLFLLSLPADEKRRRLSSAACVLYSVLPSLPCLVHPCAFLQLSRLVLFVCLLFCSAQLSSPLAFVSRWLLKLFVVPSEDEARRVRAHLNEHEGQIEDVQGTTRHHDLRLQYLEAPYKWVTRGLTSTHSFLQKKDESPRSFTKSVRRLGAPKVRAKAVAKARVGRRQRARAKASWAIGLPQKPQLHHSELAL